MTTTPDIVERLRNCEPPYFESSLRINSQLERDIDEAADEIERLRAALQQIADTENPEHYGNARDALHAVKLLASEALNPPA